LTAQAPSFWWTKSDWRARALQPLAALYGAVAARRLRNGRREKVALPVLCVGNFTVGGSGKTPVAIAFAAAAKEMGLSPGILSRGHGGTSTAPHIVDPARDTAAEVGDEPLLLAAAAPVAVTPDRGAGARLLEDRGCDFLIMDDGFQSARIRIDHALMVVDARYGLGNGHVIPAGPLRAPLAEQLRFATAILVMGEGNAVVDLTRLAVKAGKPVYRAALRPRQNLAGRRFLAFAGIGHPRKFFDTVAAAGGEVAQARAFADHHVYSDAELRELASAAETSGLEIVTTAKDAARIGRRTLDSLLARRVTVLEIEAVFDEPDAPRRLIEATLEAARGRA
jgi:tetraacyldisaccharide 4'-kinase